VGATPLAHAPQGGPANACQQRRIANAVVEAGPEAVILHADESRLQLLLLVRAMSHWVGQQLRIPTCGTNVTLALFEVSYIRTGQWVYLIREWMRIDDFFAFLECRVRTPQAPTLIIVDNFGSHTAHAVNAS
jgi:hypothetical protein